MVGELKRRQTELNKLLKNKDKEIEDLKSQGIRVSRSMYIFRNFKLKNSITYIKLQHCCENIYVLTGLESVFFLLQNLSTLSIIVFEVIIFETRSIALLTLKLKINVFLTTVLYVSQALFKKRACF